MNVSYAPLVLHSAHKNLWMHERSAIPPSQDPGQSGSVICATQVEAMWGKWRSVCVCVMYVYACMSVCELCVCACVHAHISCVLMYVCVCMHTHVYVCMWICSVYVHTHACKDSLSHAEIPADQRLTLGSFITSLLYFFETGLLLEPEAHSFG